MKNLIQFIGCVSAIAVCCLSTASHAHADVVQFSNANNIVGDSDVSLNGTAVYAFNLGDGAGTTTVVNGVTFTGLNGSNADLSFTSMGSANGTAFGNNNGASAFAALSTQYQDILESGVFGGGTGTSTITLGNLDVGTVYEVQFWVNDSRSRSDQTTVPRALEITGQGVTLTYNTAGNDTIEGLGQFAIGTFTADATTQDFAYTSAARQLNALQLRAVAVPEPSSIALLGLGAVGLLIRRRR